nr:Na+/H+ antiporter NhaC family protein [Oscillibacter sp.]
MVFCLSTGHTLLWALTLGLGLFFALGLRRGFSPRALFSMAWQKGRESLIVVPVFLLIGVVTALWRASGTISFFLYYGLQGISPAFFVLMAFLLSALLSFALGTSFGVVGTAGLVLITLGRSGGVDLAVTAGAILSGAYFGDRCSPMSSCASLVAACTGTELYANVREMLKTGALPTALTAAVFAVLSVLNPITSVDAAVLRALSENFSLHPIVLLPAVAMLALPLLKVPVKRAMAVSAAAAFLLAVFLQGLPARHAALAAIFGYVPAQGALRAILSGGGLVSMLLSAAVVFLTSLYAGILEGIDALGPAKAWTERLAARLGLFPAMCIVSAVLVAVFCNQSVMVLMDEQLLADAYRRRGASQMELAMDIANSGVLLAGLIPWSIAITVPLRTLDVGLEAMPYCVLLYAIPICYLFTKRYFRAGQNPPVSTEREESL